MPTDVLRLSHELIRRKEMKLLREELNKEREKNKELLTRAHDAEELALELLQEKRRSSAAAVLLSPLPSPSAETNVPRGDPVRA